MIVLVPSWAHHYDEFWQTIRHRNLWFIKLRFGAVLMLLAFLFGTELLLRFEYTPLQQKAILIITLSILLYNLMLVYLRKLVKCEADKFNPLHLSIIQMVLDFSALGLLVYFTGGIETPLYMLYIFHMIIGSLVLPGLITYSAAIFVIMFFTGLVTLEFLGIIPHFSVSGFLEKPIYNDAAYVYSFTTVFAFVILVSVLITNRIASQLYKMEQELIESVNKLRQAEEEKQRYIIGVVHEIKTPLAAVHSYLDVILQKYLGPVDRKVEDKLKRARGRSIEAIELINDILKFSKLKLLDKISKEELSIEALLSVIIKKQYVNAKTKNIKLSLTDCRKNKRMISGDYLLLDLAFSNVVNNAIKYVGSDGIVEISIDSNDKELLIKVCDNGVGIPESEQEKIFKEFYRASNIKNQQYEGAGLGLSIVKQIVERHQGNITVQSPSIFATEKRPGTCFVISLPFESS